VPRRFPWHAALNFSTPRWHDPACARSPRHGPEPGLVHGQSATRWIGLSSSCPSFPSPPLPPRVRGADCRQSLLPSGPRLPPSAFRSSSPPVPADGAAVGVPPSLKAGRVWCPQYWPYFLSSTCLAVSRLLLSKFLVGQPFQEGHVDVEGSSDPFLLARCRAGE